MSAARSRRSARTSGVVRDQAGNASAAAAAAASASAAVASGACPTTCSVAGLTTSYVPPPASTHSPPTSSRYGASVSISLMPGLRLEVEVEHLDGVAPDQFANHVRRQVAHELVR